MDIISVDIIDLDRNAPIRDEGTYYNRFESVHKFRDFCKALEKLNVYSYPSPMDGHLLVIVRYFSSPLSYKRSFYIKKEDASMDAVRKMCDFKTSADFLRAFIPKK